MAETHETIADVIAWLRKPREGENAYLTLWRDEIADRLDAAHRREVDEAERRANHAAMKNVSETLAKVGPLYDAESIGNAAKLREALELCMDEMCDRCRDLASARGNPLPCLNGCEPVRKAKAALAAPPRNCDRPECATTKAAADVWRKEDGGKTAYHEWLLAPATEKEGGAK